MVTHGTPSMCPVALLRRLACPILATTSMGAKASRLDPGSRACSIWKGTQMHASIPCPQCGSPARITERFWLDSTDGPVEHFKTSCVNNHWLTPRPEMVGLEWSAVMEGDDLAALAT